jgi:hypothetical protein
MLRNEPLTTESKQHVDLRALMTSIRRALIPITAVTFAHKPGLIGSVQ